MSEKPKRRFWRIHLSTVIGISLFGGLLMGLNFNGEADSMLTVGSETSEVTYERAKTFKRVLANDPTGCQSTSYGWPLKSIEIVRYYRAGNTGWEQVDRYWRFKDYDNSFILKNASICIFGMAAAIFIFEYVARRREGSKP